MNSKEFIPSFKQNDQRGQLNSPYLFFHIPKSAGMSLVSGMVSCYEQVSISLPYKPWYGRVDDVESLKSKSSINSVLKYLETHRSETLGGFIGSHTPMRVLEAVPIEFRMVTVLRNTVDRVLSAFNYDCMRHNRKPTSSDFDEFIKSPNQQNVAIKTLLGIDEVSGGESEIVANLLNQYFYAYCFIEDINLMISSILSLDNLPSLQLGKENKTIDSFRYMPGKDEIEKIKTLNKEDEKLIEILGYGSMKIPKFSTEFGLSDNVVKVLGRQTSERYGYHSRIQKLSQYQKEQPTLT